MNVRNVAKPSKSAHPLIITNESILEKSLISVTSAGEPLVSARLLFSIIEFTRGRNHMNVTSVGKPLHQYHGSADTAVFILERSPFAVICVAKCSVTTQP